MKGSQYIGKVLKKLQNHKFLQILLPSVLVMLVVLYLGYFHFFPTSTRNGVIYTRNWHGKLIGAEKASDPNERIVNAKVYTDMKANYWEIVDTSKSPQYPTGLKIYEKDLPSPISILKWNNYLLGLNIEHYVGINSGGFLDDNYPTEHYTLLSQIYSIRIYNLDTGEAYDISPDKPIYGDIWYQAGQILDNSYLFGVGGAFGANLGYKLDLPPSRTSKITKLANLLGNEVKKFGNTYITSFCYEGCTYSLFNPASLTTTPLKRLNTASNYYDNSRKEEFIGIDSQGRMIARLDTEEIIAVPLNNEKTTIPLLKSNEIPEKIQNHLMIDGIDKILMLGNSKVYMYDIAQNKLSEVQISVDTKSILSKTAQLIPSKTDKAICFTNSKDINFAIELTTGTYLNEVPENCKSQYSSSTASIVAQNIFNNLNLPNNFEFIYTSTEYKTFKIIKGIPESELPEDAEIIN